MNPEGKWVSLRKRRIPQTFYQLAEPPEEGYV